MAKKQTKKANIENEKICAILSYLLIGIVWYFVDEKMKKSSLAKYHVKQGLVLLIASIIYSLILSVILRILLLPFYITGGMIGGFGLIGLFSLLNYVPLIWTIIGIVNAANDKEKPLPLIGKWSEKFSF